jgi:2-oxoglutarate ferredoxin oxidoreductase subunit beta
MDNPFELKIETAWCPGCGNFMILNALKKALHELELQPTKVLICSGIGQAAKLPHYLNSNTFNGLHGRAIPPATAAKLVNPELTVIAEGGDGDMYGEGGNHFLHAIRRNTDITVLVHNNQVYGLTKGQASPTSEPGFVTKVQTEGVKIGMMDPLTVALSLGCGFVSRAFSGDIPHLVNIIKEAVRHRGFSLVDILMPCVSFNKINTFAWYKQRVKKLEENGHDPTDRNTAFSRAEEWGDEIPIGIFYQKERPSYGEELTVLEGKPLIQREHNPQGIEKIFQDFK